LKSTHYTFYVDYLTLKVKTFLGMEVFEDFGALYSEYVKNNEDDVMSELEFFKSAFKDAMIEMDILRQACKN